MAFDHLFSRLSATRRKRHNLVPLYSCLFHVSLYFSPFTAFLLFSLTLFCALVITCTE